MIPPDDVRRFFAEYFGMEPDAIPMGMRTMLEEIMDAVAEMNRGIRGYLPAGPEVRGLLEGGDGGVMGLLGWDAPTEQELDVEPEGAAPEQAGVPIGLARHVAAGMSAEDASHLAEMMRTPAQPREESQPEPTPEQPVEQKPAQPKSEWEERDDLDADLEEPFDPNETEGAWRPRESGGAGMENANGEVAYDWKEEDGLLVAEEDGEIISGERENFQDEADEALGNITEALPSAEGNAVYLQTNTLEPGKAPTKLVVFGESAQTIAGALDAANVSYRDNFDSIEEKMEEGKETRDGDPYDESHFKLTISGKKNVQAAIQALVGDNGDYGVLVLQDESGSLRFMLNPKSVDMEGVTTLEKARAENERLKQEIEEENRKTVAAWEARTGLKYDPEWREHIVRPDGPFREVDGSTIREGTIRNGEWDGEVREYRDGVLRKTAIYKNGNETGTLKLYRGDGTLALDRFFNEDGNAVEIHYGKDGKTEEYRLVRGKRGVVLFDSRNQPQEAPVEPAAQPEPEQKPSAKTKAFERVREPVGEHGAYMEGIKENGHWVGEVKHFPAANDKLPAMIEHYDGLGRLERIQTMYSTDRSKVYTETFYYADGTSLQTMFAPNGDRVRSVSIDVNGRETILYSRAQERLRRRIEEAKDNKYFPKESIDWELLMSDKDGMQLADDLMFYIEDRKRQDEELPSLDKKQNENARKRAQAKLREAKKKALAKQEELQKRRARRAIRQMEADAQKRMAEQGAPSVSDPEQAAAKKIASELGEVKNAALEAAAQKKREAFAKRKYALKKKNKGRTLTQEEAEKVLKPFASNDVTRLVLTKPMAFGGWRFATDGKAILFLRDEGVTNGWDASMPKVQILPMNPIEDTSKLNGKEVPIGKLSVPWLMRALDEVNVAITRAGTKILDNEENWSVVLVRSADGSFGLHTVDADVADYSKIAFNPKKEWSPVFRSSIRNLRRIGKAMLDLGEESVTLSKNEDIQKQESPTLPHQIGVSAFDDGKLRAKAVVAGFGSDHVEVEEYRSMLDRLRGQGGNTALSVGGFGLNANARAEMDKVRKQYEGTDKWMKAPNGKPTKLNERQWLQVRTPSFKAWFGDWENDPANASKVVDENGEPLVVYHGSQTAGFAVFNKNKGDRDNSIHSDAPDGSNWFSDKRGVASTYSNSDSIIRLSFDDIEEAMDNNALKDVYVIVDENNIPLEGRYYEDYDDAADWADEETDDNDEGHTYTAVPGWVALDEWMYETDTVFADEDAALKYANEHFHETQHYPANYAVFLNIRNPKARDFGGKYWHNDHVGEDVNDVAGSAQLNGFDGAIIRNVIDEGGAGRGKDEVGTDYIVFDPNAIKSATDNVGTFDPENPDIRFSVGERMGGRAPVVEPGGDVREAGEGALAWLRRKFVHSQTPVFDAVRRVMGVGREPPDALNVEASAKNVHGKIRTRQEMLQRAYLEPLKAILAQPGLDRKRFDDYALALHALERNRMIQERSVVVDPTSGEVVDLGVEAGSGVTNAWAERMMREIQRDPFAEQYKEAANILAEMNRFVLRGAVADGLLTEAQARTWMRLSPHYVPLKSGGAAPGAIHKRATGRFTRPDSVLVNSMRQAYATVRNGELNRVNKTMADWIREYDPNGEQVGGTVPESHKHAKIKMADPQYVPKGSTAEALLRERGIRLVETEDKGGYWVDTGVLPNALKRVVRESVPQGDDIVTFWENGERKFIRFEGKRGRDGRAENEAARIADALNFKNVLHKEGKFWDAIRGLTRWKANVSTSWNPTFIVRNMGADVFNTANLMMIEGKYAELARTMRNYPEALNRVERSSHAWVSFTDGVFPLAEAA